MLRGFSPCAMEIIPSMTISRTCDRACMAPLSFAAIGRKNRLARRDAVHRRGERGGDAVAELARIGEVLHHGHEAEHRADDAERGRIDAHAFEHLGCARVRGFARVELDFQRGADRLRLAAVDDELQALAHEGVTLLLELLLEAEQTLLARDDAPLDDLLDEPLRIPARAA